MHAFSVFNFVARVNVAQIAELDTQIVTSDFERDASMTVRKPLGGWTYPCSSESCPHRHRPSSSKSELGVVVVSGTGFDQRMDVSFTCILSLLAAVTPRQYKQASSIMQ